jgi:hypothetical protein
MRWLIADGFSIFEVLSGYSKTYNLTIRKCLIKGECACKSLRVLLFRAREPLHQMVLRVRVVIPPVLAAEADDGFASEHEGVFFIGRPFPGGLTSPGD